MEPVVVEAVGIQGWVVSAASLVAPAVDLGDFYQNAWGVVDFLLLFALFAGTARATVGRRLEGRAGQMVSLALGAILAIAGIGLESMTGFTLASLGSVAGAIFIVLAGTMVFLLLKRLGLGAGTSAAVSVLVLAVGLSAVVPGTAGPIGFLISLSQIGAVVAAGALIVKALLSVRKLRAGGNLSGVAAQVEALEPAMEGVRGRGRGGPLSAQLKQERHTISRRLRPVTKREEKDSAGILRELRLIDQTLSSGSLSPKDRRIVASALARVPPERHRLKVDLDRVRGIDRALLRFDANAMFELRQRLQRLGDADRKALRKLILEERRKIGIERRIDQIERFVATYDANAARSLQQAGVLLVQSQLPDARQWVAAAIRYEEEAERMIERVRAVERMLVRLTRLEVRQAARAA